MATRFSALRSFLNGGAPADEEEQSDPTPGAPAEGEGDDEGEGTPPPSGDDEGEESEDDEGTEQPASTANSARKATVAERRRWASVLTHANAEGRLEAATGLLVENLSASAITRILGGMPQDTRSAAYGRLASTPRHNLGGNPPAGEGKSGDAAAESRKRATGQVNAGLDTQRTTNARQRVAGNGRKGA